MTDTTCKPCWRSLVTALDAFLDKPYSRTRAQNPENLRKRAPLSTIDHTVSCN